MFASDARTVLSIVEGFVNSALPDGTDELRTRAQVRHFVRTAPVTGVRAVTAQDVEDARAMRERLRRIWQSPVAEAVTQVNALLADTGVVPHLVPRGSGYHMHMTPPGSPLAVRIGSEAAAAFAELIRTDQFHRAKTCQGGCGRVVLDLSKNSSRAYCDHGCGNRVNAAAYRSRKARRAGREGEPWTRS